MQAELTSEAGLIELVLITNTESSKWHNCTACFSLNQTFHLMHAFDSVNCTFYNLVVFNYGFILFDTSCHHQLSSYLMKLVANSVPIDLFWHLSDVVDRI